MKWPSASERRSENSRDPGEPLALRALHLRRRTLPRQGKGGTMAVGVTHEYDDGGRKAAGFRGETNDCVCRAIAIVTGIPYNALPMPRKRPKGLL